MSALDLVLFKAFAGLALAGACFAGVYVPRALRLYSAAHFEYWVPVGNALSAGLLIGAGLLHFFAGSVVRAIPDTALEDSHGHAAFETPCHEGAEAAVSRCCFALVGGFFLSLVIDRVVMRSAALAPLAAQHGHSHGFHDVEAEPLRSPSPAVLRGSTTAALVVAVLLGLHGGFEGVALAVEPSVQAIQRGFLPLLLHKFFDGLVMGIQASLALEMDPSGARGFSTKAALWSLITPFVMAGFLVSGLDSWLVATSQPTPVPPGIGAHSAAWNSALPWGPLLQCVGAGTFLYVATLEILPGEFPATPVAPKAGAAAPWLKAVAAIAGVGFVIVLEGAHSH